MSKYEIGQLVRCTVVMIVPHAVFTKLEGDDKTVGRIPARVIMG